MDFRFLRDVVSIGLGFLVRPAGDVGVLVMVDFLLLLEVRLLLLLVDDDF